MTTEHLIAIQELSAIYNVEISFVNSLNEYGLIEITTIEQTEYISKEQLNELEKMMRLHYELDINMEGIDTIAHILKRVDYLHEELTALKNKLKLYEGE
jgi:hypothetical protein